MARIALGGLLVLLFMMTAIAGEPAVRLAAETERRVNAGEIVVLDELPPGGDAKNTQGGTAVALVHAAPDSVWRLLVDYANHATFYPRVVDSRVLESTADHTLVRYVVGVGPFSFGFHVNNFPEPARGRLEWRLDHERPNDLFRESWGYWQIEPRAGASIVTYALAARTVLPAFLTRGAERDGLVSTVRALRARAEAPQPSTTATRDARID